MKDTPLPEGMLLGALNAKVSEGMINLNEHLRRAWILRNREGPTSPPMDRCIISGCVFPFQTCLG
jgi:hypothetical protein